jgi:hypothetical protein
VYKQVIRQSGGPNWHHATHTSPSKTSAACPRPDEVEELASKQRIEPAGGLVENQQLKSVREGLHDADLLPVALRQPSDRTIEVEVEALGQGHDHVATASTAQARQMMQQLPCRLPPVRSVEPEDLAGNDREIDTGQSERAGAVPLGQP